ncbi:MAG: ribbon-helix-helix protein, CopG family [Bryobacteraceae bacterium]
MSTKVTVNLPDETVNEIKNLAAVRGTTVTEALRQVIETQSFLQNEIDKGNNLLIQDPSDKSLRQIIFNTSLKGSSNAK